MAAVMYIQLFVLAAVSSLVLLANGSPFACNKSPIVLIPGIMGSQLEASLDHKQSNHWYCFKTYSDWYRIWLDIDDVFVLSQDCFRENIRLYYNQTLGSYGNRHGVNIRVRPPQFGGTGSLETLDPNVSEAAYFDKFIEFFEGLGYQRNSDIVGAGYDWRLGPAELTQTGYFANLKSLIEHTSSLYNGCPVTMVAHSMGGLVSHHFLINTVTQEWKDKYIHQYITLGAVWGGATQVLKALISGNQDHVFKMSKPLVLREDERSFPSGYWLIPRPIDTIWKRTQTMVTTPTKQYTAFDLYELIKDLNYEYGLDRYNGVMKSSIQGLPPPNVTTYCLYGSDLDTEQSYVYGNGKFPDNQPVITNGKGDGTVNLQSLEACRLWVGQQSYNVQWYPLNRTDHIGIVRTNHILKFIKNLVIH